MTTSPRAELSKSLFNSVHRLDVAAAIGEYDVGEQFYAHQIQNRLKSEYDTPPSRTAQEIELFEEFDMIQRIGLGSQPKFTRIYYERTDSGLMIALIGVADMAIQRAAGL
jgi:ABC-type thiamine transport system ATPase subunit